MTKRSEGAVLERIARKLDAARGWTVRETHRDPQAILRARARELAAEVLTSKDDAAERLQVIEFLLSGERFAVEARSVREVFVLSRLVTVPCTPPFVAGVVNLRGTIVSVFDLRPLLGLGGDAPMDRVLLLSDRVHEFGILAEAIDGAREIAAANLSPPLATLPESARRFQRGVFPGPVSLLDTGLLLSSSQLRVGGGESPIS